MAAQTADPDPDSLPPTNLFYQPELGCGSEAYISPLTILLNRGFSNLFDTGIERRPHKIDWGSGLDVVLRSVFRPSSPIRDRGGWGAWFQDEFVPGMGPIWTWGWSVNYAGHILAGGVTYRYLQEWFAHQGMPLAGLVAGTFLRGTMVVNEIVELRGSTGIPRYTVEDDTSHRSQPALPDLPTPRPPAYRRVSSTPFRTVVRLDFISSPRYLRENYSPSARERIRRPGLLSLLLRVRSG